MTNQTKPYCLYWTNSREQGEEARKRQLEWLRDSKVIDVEILPTTGCPTLHFFPKGKASITHASFYGPTQINRNLLDVIKQLL